MKISPREAIAPLFAGLVLRLALLLVVDYSGPPTGDASQYTLLARNLIEHRSFSLMTSAPFEPTMMRPPAYPFFLAALGNHLVLSAIVQALMGCATAWIVADAVSRRSARAGRWTLWLAALCPFDAIAYGRQLTETLCTFLLVGALSVPRGAALRWFAIAGAMLGWACLTRDVFLPLVMLVPAYWLWSRRRAPAAARRGPLVYALCAALAIAPWTARNVLTMHSATPISKGNLWFNLWVGTWEREPSWQQDVLRFPPYAFLPGDDRAFVQRWAEAPFTSAAPRDAVFKQLTLSHLRTRPVSVAKTWVIRAPRMWIGTRTDLYALRLSRGSVSWLLFKLGAFALNLVFVAGGAMGAVVAYRRRRLRLFVLVLAFTTAIYVPFHNTETRYTQPVYPLLLACFAYGASRSRPLARSRSSA